jgi:hypothetical protein
MAKPFAVDPNLPTHGAHPSRPIQSKALLEKSFQVGDISIYIEPED